MKKVTNGLLVLVAFCFMSCHKYAIRKYQLGRNFDFKSKVDFENYLNKQKVFDVTHVLYPDSSSYLKFITEKLKQDSTVAYVGSYLNDTTCIGKSDFLSKNTSCKGRIEEEIIRNINTVEFPDSLVLKVNGMSLYNLHYLKNSSLFDMNQQHKKLKIFLAYSYSFGTYYDNLFRKVIANQKSNESTTDVFIVCMDPIYYLK